MLENIGLVAGTLLATLGAALLFGGPSAGPNQNAAFALIGGAAAFAAGLIAVALILKSKLYWHRIQKQNRQRT